MSKKPKKIEKDAVRTTIVGGRPPGSGKDLGPVPRGIEDVVRKAAMDPSFRNDLLLAERQNRSRVASRAAIKLSAVESLMLQSLDKDQLSKIINAIRSDMVPGARPLASTRGRPRPTPEPRDWVPPSDVRTKGIRPDRPGPTLGHSPR